MTRRTLIFPVILSLAGLLLHADAALAQRGRTPRVVPRPIYHPVYSYPQYRYYAPTVIYPTFRYAPTYVVPTYSYYPPVPVTPPPAAPTSAVADIRVILPDPQAQVFFNDRATTSTGTERLYHTPALAFGGTYAYRIRAIWTQSGQRVTQERVVTVAPGQTAVVDFTQPLSETLPPPTPRN